MKRKDWKILNLILLVFIFIFPIFLNFYLSFNYSSEINYSDVDFDTTISSFSKEDYKPILESPEYGLGNINLTKLDFNEPGIFNYTLDYPELDDDLFISGALSISYRDTSFIQTLKIAQFNNLDETEASSNQITILINESISIAYNHSKENSEGFMIYNPRLYPRELKQIFIQNESSSTIEELNSEDYTIDTKGFIKFNYFSFFNDYNHNFSMYIIFEFSLVLKNWQINQGTENILEMTSEEHIFNPSFFYNFTLNATQYNASVVQIPANNLEVRLILNPLDKELFYDHHLLIDDKVENDFLEPDNSLNFTMFADEIDFSLKFKLNFTIRFTSPVDFSWAIDRLKEGRDVRERIYLPEVISGPKYIYLNNVTFIEKTITFDQIKSTSSIFGRTVDYYDIIILISQQSVEYSLIFTRNAVKRKGLEVVIPYIITGEIVPFIIEYRANNNLRIILTDNINMPLIGSKIELFYYDKPYGTYISDNFSQPMAPAYSDENGEIIIYNIPNGNYTIKVYQNERLIKQGLLNTFSQISIIKSNIIHFPIWIIIFGSISLIITILGLFYYKINKKRI